MRGLAVKMTTWFGLCFTLKDRLHICMRVFYLFNADIHRAHSEWQQHGYLVWTILNFSMSQQQSGIIHAVSPINGGSWMLFRAPSI